MDWCILQPYQERERKRYQEEFFEKQRQEREDESIQKIQKEWNEWIQPPLYQAKIVRVFPNLDGPLTLHRHQDAKAGTTDTSVQLGDVVEVLQEQVGPAKAYTLCRIIQNSHETTVATGDGKSPSVASNNMGWYPTHALERL